MSVGDLSVVRSQPAPRTRQWQKRGSQGAAAVLALSLAWMGAEGAIAITAGVVAGSIALLSFGLDSAIEGVASLVIVWRFTGSRLLLADSTQGVDRTSQCPPPSVDRLTVPS